jgi:hypothetical protein
MTNRAAAQTDDQLVSTDIGAMLVEGLPLPAAATGLFGDVAVAAAIRADRLGVQPRSLTFLAEIVRRGGVGYATDLPEPLPTAEQTALVREWLSAAVRVDGSDLAIARWLDAVAAVLGVRKGARFSGR